LSELPKEVFYTAALFAAKRDQIGAKKVIRIKPLRLLANTWTLNDERVRRLPLLSGRLKAPDCPSGKFVLYCRSILYVIFAAKRD
jgi:hypothetical protein